MPDTFTVAAKFWVGLAGAVVIAVITALGHDAPQWLTVVAGVLAAIGVYLVPNAAKPVRLTGDDLDAAQAAASAVDALPDADEGAAA